MHVLVTGSSGFVGSALIPRLQDDGHAVRALARDEARLRRALGERDGAAQHDLDVVIGDVVSGAGLEAALSDVEVAYYLIHSMERSTDGPFPEREHRAGENFAAAARRAGVRRIVYLGGLLPTDRRASRHLASRLAVEEIMLGAAPESVALRASIVIGARSRSFRFLVRLVERLPVLALPAWRRFRTAPIDARDVVELMLGAGSSAAVAGQSLDIAGPEVLTYQAIVEGIADHMLVGRPALGLRVTMTPLAAPIAAAVAGEDPGLILPLMEGLEGDLLPRDRRASELLGVRLHSFDSAVEHALREWESREPLSAR
jgi:uncharacterized protein YbjT (DUF2867 family)